MTKEEIKVACTVPEILGRQGVQVRNGRCRAVCHEGTHYTAKVSRELYHCFKCGHSMDVFDLTMHFNNCDFKAAIELLGGSERPSFRTAFIAEKAVREKKEREYRKQEYLKKRKEILLVMRACRNIIKENEPFTDIWCYAANKLTYQEYLYDYLEEEYGIT